MPEEKICHLFVETNWVHDYAAPAHHKVPAAVTLFEWAQRGDFILHIPNVSFAEARQSIQNRKMQEEYESWLRRLREEAYVEYRLDKGGKAVEKTSSEKASGEKPAT